VFGPISLERNALKTTDELLQVFNFCGPVELLI
jgi:hypothetical protein